MARALTRPGHHDLDAPCSHGPTALILKAMCSKWLDSRTHQPHIAKYGGWALCAGEKLLYGVSTGSGCPQTTRSGH